jgi:hypothetical protein
MILSIDFPVTGDAQEMKGAAMEPMGQSIPRMNRSKRVMAGITGAPVADRSL